MTIKEYQELASRTINAELPPEDQAAHALFGMASEVGELHGIYQKIYQGHELNEGHVIKELGDILWNIAEFCTAQGWSLEDVCRINIKKLRERYPDGFSRERSLHRKEGDI